MKKKNLYYSSIDSTFDGVDRNSISPVFFCRKIRDSFHNLKTTFWGFGLILKLGLLTSCQCPMETTMTPANQGVTLEPPTFSLSAGEYAKPTNVSLMANGPTPGTNPNIYYTFTANGSVPEDPTTNSTLYDGNPISILNSIEESPYHIKAVSILAGYSNSIIASATYNLSVVTLEPPTFSLSAGEYAKPTNISLMANGPTPGTNPNIYYTFTANGSVPEDPTTNSTLYDGNPISILNSIEESSYHIKAVSILAGYSNSIIASATYNLSVVTLEPPTFSLSAGEYTKPTNVSLMANGPTPGTNPNIYYTFTANGSVPEDPTTNSTLYDGNPISILNSIEESSYHIKAVSILAGYSNSIIASATYNLSDSDSDSYADAFDVDDDGNGLIEIATIEQLYFVRFNMTGTSYNGNSNGCGGMTSITTCNGYELTANIDFDGDNDGSTWSGDASTVYTLDSGDNIPTFFVISEGGWLPIGDTVATPFNAIFDGKGFEIRNLAVSRDQNNIGLFGLISTNAVIRNLGGDQWLS